jgi:hypothetical protein
MASGEGPSRFAVQVAIVAAVICTSDPVMLRSSTFDRCASCQLPRPSGWVCLSRYALASGRGGALAGVRGDGTQIITPRACHGETRAGRG